MDTEKKRRLAAIIFTDIEGYTQLMEESEAQAQLLRKRHREVFEHFHQQHQGEIIQYFGDGTLSIFDSCVEAVKCAISMQQAFQEEPKVPLRIGIHLGDIEYSDVDIVGSGVNIASRVESLGVVGAVLISDDVKKQVKNHEIETVSMGKFAMKNVREPIEVFAVKADKLIIPELKQMQGKAKSLSRKSKINNPPKPIRNAIRILAGLGIITLLILFSSLYTDFYENPETSSAPYQMKPLTNTIWFEGTGSWAPDGERFVFSSVEKGNTDIYVRHKTGGEAIQLTNSPFDEGYPRWSTDGSLIAFTSVRTEGTNIYLIPSTGGLERKIAETNISGLETNVWINYLMGVAPWSPDGTELLYSQMRPNGAVGISKKNINTGEEIWITKPDANQIDFCASWAPDGTSIIYQRNGNLWTKSLLGDQEEKLILPDKQIFYPAYLANGSRIVFVHHGNVWELDLPSMNLRKLTSVGSKRVFSIAVIPNGGLSVDDFRHQTDLRRLNLEKKEEKGYAEEQLTYYNGDNFYGRFSPDGNKIIYHSSRTGNREIWLMDLEKEKREINLTEHTATDFCGDWSPDGEKIAFFSGREDGLKVWIMDKDGNILQKASDTLVNLAPIPFAWPHQLRWSPDGEKIAYMALSNQGHSLWVIDLKTQQAEPLVHGVYSFTWYLSDNMIICNRKASAQTHATDLVAVNIETGEEKILRENMPVTELFTTVDGQWLGYTSAIGHMSYNLYRINLNPPNNSEDGWPSLIGEPEQLTFATPWHTHTGCFSPDGKSIIYTLDQDEMDVYILDGYE